MAQDTERGKCWPSLGQVWPKTSKESLSAAGESSRVWQPAAKPGRLPLQHASTSGNYLPRDSMHQESELDLAEAIQRKPEI